MSPLSPHSSKWVRVSLYENPLHQNLLSTARKCPTYRYNLTFDINPFIFFPFFSRCFWISWLENLQLLSLVVGLLQNLNFVNIYQTGFLQCFKTMFFIYTQVNEYVKKVNFQHINNSLIKIFSVLKSLQSALVNPSVTSLATQIIQPNYYLSDYMKDCPVLK